MDKRFERHLPYYLLLAFLINFIILAFLSEGSVGGADDISHFKFSRYAFKHPEFFLDPWGKPLFTILMAPFAQFGHNGVKVFNILLGLGAAFLTFLTARNLNYKYPVLSLFLLVFAPMYMALMISGMTEILFSFILILGIYLFFNNRSIASAMVISLLPFVRTEGVIIFPLFLLAYLLNRQWKAIPFFLTGVLFFSIIGSFHYEDFFWVINTMPYKGDAAAIYGSGELLYYVKKFRPIFGPALFFMILVGLLYIPIHFFGKGREIRKPFLTEVLVGFLPFLLYFAAHSYVWWKGQGNSVGEIRVMAAVLPPAVLLALFGWNGLMRWIPLSKFMKICFALMLALLLVFSSFSIQKIPVELAPTQQLVKVAAQWLKGSEYANRKIYYFDPYWWFFLDKDPTDRSKLQQWLPDAQHPQNYILHGELILWDAHFGPNEGQVPLQRLKENSNFQQVKAFRPDEPYQVLGGYDYEICIFERTGSKPNDDLQMKMEQGFIRDDSSYRVRILDYHDFEDPVSEDDSLYFRSEFIPGIKMSIMDLKLSEGSRIIANLSHLFSSFPIDDYPKFVLSLQDSDQVYFNRSWEIRPNTLNNWEESSFERVIPKWKSPNDILKVYVWNRDSHQFYFDDFIIGLKEHD